jgi:hypothetical protein
MTGSRGVLLAFGVIASCSGAVTGAERSASVPAVAATQPAIMSADSSIPHADLDMPIAEFDAGSATLQQAIDRLRRQTHANLVVLWPELEREGIRRDTRVELHLWDTTLRKVLESLLVLGGGTWERYVGFHDNMILVGPEPDLGDAPRLSARIYDMRDVIDEAMAYRRSHPPNLAPATAAQAANVNEAIATEYAREPGVTAVGTAEAIMDLIERSVDPQSWNNGVVSNTTGPGRIEEFAGRLIIVQTAVNHQRIAALIRTLRPGASKERTKLPADAR